MFAHHVVLVNAGFVPVMNTQPTIPKTYALSYVPQHRILLEMPQVQFVQAPCRYVPVTPSAPHISLCPEAHEIKSMAATAEMNHEIKKAEPVCTCCNRELPSYTTRSGLCPACLAKLPW